MLANSTARGCFIEFAGILGFVLIAGLLTIFFEHPDLSNYSDSLQHNALLRRLIPALVMGLYIACIIQLAAHKTGMQINPAATLTFFRLNKINTINTILFMLVQFAGALAGVWILNFVFGNYFSHPKINFGNTQPQGSRSHLIAFFAEWTISFLFMYAGLMCSSVTRLKRYTAAVLGSLICLFVLFETPLSGMSLNPARSFAAAFVSGQWTYLWIYFSAPTLGMLVAAELFIISKAASGNAHGRALNSIPDYPQ